MITSKLRKPMSVSIKHTFLSINAKAVPMLAVVVVLPTPPFPEVITIASPIMHSPFESAQIFSQMWKNLYSVNNNFIFLFINETTFHIHAIRFIIRSATDKICNTELTRLHIGCSYYCISISIYSRMRNPAEIAHNENISCRDYFTTRVHISDKQKITSYFQNLSGPYYFSYRLDLTILLPSKCFFSTDNF